MFSCFFEEQEDRKDLIVGNEFASEYIYGARRCEPSFLGKNLCESLAEGVSEKWFYNYDHRESVY